MPRRAALLALVAVLAAACTRGSGVSAGPPAQAAVPTAPTVFEKESGSSRLVPPRKGAWFGAFVNQSGVHGTRKIEREISAFERSIGRRLAIDHHYNGWAMHLNQPIYRWDLANHRVPLISWAHEDTRAIAGGSQDRLIAKQADRLRSLRGPVMLEWGWEMNGGWNQSWVISPWSYVAAWRHIHDIFVRRHATNVSWVWCPDTLAFRGGVAALYYPGSAYVDWVCADGYNWAPAASWARWRSFADLFSDFYSWGARTGKPLLVGETGALERNPGEKARWLTDAEHAIETRFPLIKAFVYFDSGGRPPVVADDWRVTTSPETFRAFVKFANDPYFNPPPPA